MKHGTFTDIPCHTRTLSYPLAAKSSPQIGHITEHIELMSMASAPRLSEVGLSRLRHDSFRRSPQRQQEITISAHGTSEEKDDQEEQLVSPVNEGSKVQKSEMEPFPAFVDIYPPVEPEPLHCKMHCKHPVCMRIWHHTLTPCACGKNGKGKVTATKADSLPAVKNDESKPRLNIDVTVYTTLFTYYTEADVSQVIELDLCEIKDCIKAYSRYALEHAASFDDCVQHYGEDHAEEILMGFCDTMKLYFEKKLNLLAIDGKPLMIRDIEFELPIYAVTEYYNWVMDVYPSEIAESLMIQDWRFALEKKVEGPPDIVREFWKNGYEGVVAMLLWRQQEILRHREEIRRRGEEMKRKVQEKIRQQMQRQRENKRKLQRKIEQKLERKIRRKIQHQRDLQQKMHCERKKAKFTLWAYGLVALGVLAIFHLYA